MSEMEVRADSGAGLPAFSYYMPYHPRFLKQLKSLLHEGVPVLMRLYPGMEYPMSNDDLHDSVDREGHVVTIVGYDDDAEEVIVLDPWNKEWGGTRGDRTRISYKTLAVVAVDGTFDYLDAPVPWEMSMELQETQKLANTKEFQLLVSVFYRCPEPFSQNKDHVTPLSVRVELPQGLELKSPAEKVFTDGIRPGEVVKASWNMLQTGDVDDKILVRASGSLKETHPYPYEDTIGSCGALHVTRVAPAGSRLGVFA